MMQMIASKQSRLPVSVFSATVVVFVYLMLARAHGVIAGGSMLHAIFAYTLDAGLVASYALRAGLVFAVALSVAWLALSWAAQKSVDR